ncbi:DUF2726 domain-containing protein [Mergibacter septicus]|nr:DUF2726 domain-containing protein [Mergibacter septicus]
MVLYEIVNYLKSKLQSKNYNGNNQYKKRFILTKTESQLFRYLINILPNHIILAQVPFSCIIRPINNERRLFWKINQKRVDFVVLDKRLNTVFIVELDDTSHSSKKRYDIQRDQLFNSCGIRTLRIKTKDNNFNTVKYKLERFINKYLRN